MPIGKKENKMLQLTVYYMINDFGPIICVMLIMNIGSVDPNFTGSRAIAGAGNAQPTIDLEIFGTHKRVFYTCKDETKIVSSLLVLYL
jgi:hypothetical protein